jgi:hypothetical protein
MARIRLSRRVTPRCTRPCPGRSPGTTAATPTTSCTSGPASSGGRQLGWEQRCVGRPHRPAPDDLHPHRPQGRLRARRRGHRGHPRHEGPASEPSRAPRDARAAGGRLQADRRPARPVWARCDRDLGCGREEQRRDPLPARRVRRSRRRRGTPGRRCLRSGRGRRGQGARRRRRTSPGSAGST